MLVVERLDGAVVVDRRFCLGHGEDVQHLLGRAACDFEVRPRNAQIGYLVKSGPPEQLVQAIRDVFSGGAPMSGSIARKVVQHFHLLGPSPEEANNLSPREQQVISLLASGYLYKEIGARLNIGVETVRTYVKSICQKMHVRSRIEAVAKHQKEGL